MNLSIGKAWTDSIADMQRRFGDFVLPVAAFVFLPAIVAARFGDVADVGEGGALAAQIVAGLIGVVGQAAVVVLVLDPAAEVGTAIRRAASAAPRIMLALAAILAVFLPAGYAIQSLRQPGGGAAIAMFVVSLAAIYVAVRLSLLAVTIVAENASAIGGLKRSWELTAGSVGRILLLIVTVIVALILLSAVVGAIGLIVSGGTPEDPSFFSELLLSAIGAIFSIFLSVATVHIYRQLVA